MIGHRAEQNEMQFLKDVCNPDLYAYNAFRVTGLDVTISQKEAIKFSKEREQCRRIGIIPPSLQSSIFPLATPPDDEDIKHAVDHKLSHPYRRIVEELFWFWPQNAHQPDIALQALHSGDKETARTTWLAAIESERRNAVSLHNLAVFYHLTALEAENSYRPQRSTKFYCPHCQQHLEATPDMFGNIVDCPNCKKKLRIPKRPPPLPEKELELSALWKSADSCWSQLWINMDFWAELANRAAELDETITPDKIEVIREQLPESLLSINAQLAIVYCNNDLHLHAERHAQTIQVSKFSDKHRHNALRQATTPVANQVHLISKLMEKKVLQNPETGLSAAIKLLENTRPLLKCLSVLNANGVLGIGFSAHDAVADAAMTGLIAYGEKTQDWESMVEPNRELLAIAHSEALKDRFTKNLATLEANAHWQVTEREVKPVQNLCDAIMQETGFVAGDQIIGPRSTPEERYRKFLSMVLPRLNDIGDRVGHTSEAYKIVADICAVCLRSISIALYNESKNYDLALEAIQRAGKLCKDGDFLAAIDNDRRTCQQRVEHIRSERRAKLIGSVILCGIVLFFIVIGNINSCSSSSSSISPAASYPLPYSVGSYKRPQPYTPPNHSPQSKLAQEINFGKRRATEFEARIKAFDKQIDEKERSLESYRQQMDNYKKADYVSAYNDLVPTYNSYVERLRALAAQRESTYNEYKQLIDDVNAKVARYNAMR